MDHQLDSYILPKIQFTLLKKHESSSSSSSSSSSLSTPNNLSLLDPRIHVEFTLKDYVLLPSDSSNNNNNGSIFTATNDPPLKLSTMALTLHENICYKEIIWMSMTCLGVEERFINQVVEELEQKVDELFTNFRDYAVNNPGLIVNEFSVHARVDILRIKGGLSSCKVGDDANVCGFAGLDWASRKWPVEWLV